VAPFAIGLVATPCCLSAVALGSLVVVQACSFTTLCLPEAIQRVLSALGLSVGKVMLVEQSRPELTWPVDVILSGRWRAFALSHHLLVGDHLVFRFKLGALEAMVRVVDADSVRRTYPLPVVME
jgi:hypothetical protein